MSGKINMVAAVTVATPTSHGLSFVVTVGEVVCFWSPQRHAEYEVETARGRAYAKELIAYIQASENPVIFGSVVRAMAEAGVYKAAEIGFCSAIGIELLGVGG